MAAQATADAMPEDGRRSILTDREREVLSGEADVSEKYYFVVVSRVRKKIEGLGDDLAFLDEHHEDLGDELRAAVQEDSQDSEE